MESAEPQHIEVELAVVGIRHYLPRGEADYDELFKRVPVGSTVYLSIDPPGTEYAGAISVYDIKDSKIGNIADPQIHLIEAQVQKEGVLSVTICEQCRHENCLRVKAVNTVGITEPHIIKPEPRDGEIVFALTPHDERLMLLPLMLKTKAKQMLDGVKENIHLVKTAKEYAKICCSSLDGDTTYARQDIMKVLKDVSGKYPKPLDKLDEIISSIYEQDKDLCRKDIQTKVYKEQYNRIKESAAVPLPDKTHSQMEEYLQRVKLEYGELNQDAYKAEYNRISQLLFHELKEKYFIAMESDQAFANFLKFRKYSMRATYILYTRRILRDYLSEKFGESLTSRTDPDVLALASQQVGESKSLENQEEADPVVKALMPIFLNNKHEVVDFLHRIKGAIPISVTARVNELLKQGKVDPVSCYTPLYKILHDNGYYKPSLSNWNNQIG